jgi:signal transduction histidine kinase
VEVVLEIPADLPLIYADPLHVTQVLVNLITNAYQSMDNKMPNERELKVSAIAESAMIKINVQDRGVGIPPENMKQLFQPLFTTKTRGIGLGLAVSRKLAEANSGRIEVESEAGKGSTFTVYLPVYKES